MTVFGPSCWLNVNMAMLMCCVQCKLAYKNECKNCTRPAVFLKIKCYKVIKKKIRCRCTLSHADWQSHRTMEMFHCCSDEPYQQWKFSYHGKLGIWSGIDMYKIHISLSQDKSLKSFT